MAVITMSYFYVLIYGLAQAICCIALLLPSYGPALSLTVVTAQSPQPPLSSPQTCVPSFDYQHSLTQILSFSFSVAMAPSDKGKKGKKGGKKVYVSPPLSNLFALLPHARSCDAPCHSMYPHPTLPLSFPTVSTPSRARSGSP